MLLIAVVALVTGCSSGGGSDPVGTERTAKDETAAVISVNPAMGATDVSPTQPIAVTVADGTLSQVTLTNPEGAPVEGQLAPDGRSWQSTAPLGYGKAYTVNATALGAANKPVTSTSSFTTVAPRTVTYPSMNPIDGETVGVGQPLAVYFDEPIANKQAAQDAITVSTEPAVEGAFYWFSDTEVHWRPQDFWAPGTTITLDIEIYGKDLGNGVYGQEDRTATFTIGDSFIARADGATHEMTIEVNGSIVKTMPISMGKPSFPSNDGVHVVTERHETKTMDSTTYGLELTEGGYITKVKWATRISNGGEFVHAAPWSVGQQGSSNVSHGCINVSNANAQWFHDNVKKGDIVINTNTGGPELKAYDGFGDWQISWSEWLTGGNI